MPDENMTQFKTEGTPIFPVENKEETSTDSSTESDNTDQTGSSTQDKKEVADKTGGADNFADHPRWKEREEDWKKRYNEQEERHTAELAKFREDIDARFRTKPPDAPVEVPSWFGGDENSWKEFQIWNQTHISKAKEEARTEALKEIETKSAMEQKAIADATSYFQEQVAVIESDKAINPEGVKVDRNKLLKFVLDNELVDTKGRWNYRAAFQMMKSGITSTKADATNERKQIAGATTSENRAETKPPAYMTSTDFNKPGARPW